MPLSLPEGTAVWVQWQGCRTIGDGWDACNDGSRMPSKKELEHHQDGSWDAIRVVVRMPIGMAVLMPFSVAKMISRVSVAVQMAIVMPIGVAVWQSWLALVPLLTER